MKPRTKPILLASLTVLLALSVLLLAACDGQQGDAEKTASRAPDAAASQMPDASASQAPDAAASEPSTRSITDFSGVTVEIPAELDSIAASYAAAEEIFVMLGAQEKNIGVSDDNLTNKWLTLFDPSLPEKARIFPGWALDQEALLKADPQLVVCHSPEIAQEVRDLGIAAIYAMGTDPDSLIETIGLIGSALGGDAQAKAEELADFYKQNMAQATERTAGLEEGQIKRVYYTTGTDPLNTEGKGSIVTSWIEMAGGRNVAADAGVEGMFVDVDLEDILVWDPEVIVSCAPKATELFLSDSRFADLTAVKNGAVYSSPEGAFVWCVRSADEAMMTLWAATVIQPELFGDIDYSTVVADFYERFYGYSLTDDEIQSILHPNS